MYNNKYSSGPRRSNSQSSFGGHFGGTNKRKSFGKSNYTRHFSGEAVTPGGQGEQKRPFGAASHFSGGYRGNTGSRAGGRNSGYGNRSARPMGGGRSSYSSHINTSQFIKKAMPIIKIEEAITVNNFEDFNLNEILLANVRAKGYIKPTPIQDQVIPHLMQNKDILGIANTGTGKTAAFALPLINEILNNPGKRIIILAPTRELAMQIKQDFRSFTPGLNVYIALAIGGAYIREQIIDIRRDPHIIIGTPGRIKDLGERRVINFAKLNTVVLDEVDRMLDMGFIDDIRSIMDKIPKTRQTLFFSATVNKKIEVLIDTLLTDPVKISVKTQDSSSHVEQNIVQVTRSEKESKLCELLGQEQFKKVLVFGATQMIVEKLSNNLTTKGFKVASLHGGKPQHKRQAVMRLFKENVINVLIATDVAARGLDIADITHVINYDKPNNYDDYCHRIGRTGRGDKMGNALTFVESRY
jgi:ATP-dependent RNA helicase RhlE